MKWRALFFISIPVTVFITVMLYEPAYLFIYRISEPDFGYPLKISARELVIRNDAMGEGEFGARRHGARTHAGIDMLASVGTPVYASKSGTAFCGNVPTGYGRYVMIYHPDGFQSFYGHLTNWAIPPVKKVRKGDLIGFVGKTGNASSRLMQPHLHFEIRRDGEPQNPVSLLK